MSKTKAVFGIVSNQALAIRTVAALKVAGFSAADISTLFPVKSGAKDFPKEGNILLSVHASSAYEIDRAKAILKNATVEDISRQIERRYDGALAEEISAKPGCVGA